MPRRKPTLVPPAKKKPLLIDVSTLDLLNEEPIGREEAMEFLGVKKDTLRYYINYEGLPCSLIAGHYEFYKTLLRAWRVNRQIID